MCGWVTSPRGRERAGDTATVPCLCKVEAGVLGAGAVEGGAAPVLCACGSRAGCTLAPRSPSVRRFCQLRVPSAPLRTLGDLL